MWTAHDHEMGTEPARRHRRRVAKAVLLGVLALLPALMSPVASDAAGTGSTGSQLQSAKERLAALERRIGAESGAVADTQAHLLVALSKLDAARSLQEHIQGQLVDLQVRLRDTQASYGAIQARLNARAVNAYMFGPQQGFEIVLGATSASDLADRVGFADALVSSDAELGRRTGAAAAQLDRLRASQSTLLRSQDRAVTTLQAQERDVSVTFATEQDALANLAQARDDLTATVAALQARLDREEQAALDRANHGASVEAFDQWSQLLLGQLGFATCVNDRIVIVAWETAEFTRAAWNPLATTHWMPGATDFNSVGVKNYVSMDQGLQATVETLRGGTSSYGYGAILDGLAGCDDPLATAMAINASAWCRGCAGGQYVVDVVPTIEAYFHSHGIG